MGMKYESDKMQYVSILRVCSMMLIVLYHSLCFYIGVWWYFSADVIPLWKVISTPTVKIGLTTFVFISGFLYGYMYLERRKYISWSLDYFYCIFGDSVDFI